MVLKGFMMYDLVEEEKRTRYIRAKEHVKDMMETREYYKNRKIKREEIVALEFLKKAVRELYIEQEDRNKAKVSLHTHFSTRKNYSCSIFCFFKCQTEAG